MFAPSNHCETLDADRTKCYESVSKQKFLFISNKLFFYRFWYKNLQEIRLKMVKHINGIH